MASSVGTNPVPISFLCAVTDKDGSVWDLFSDGSFLLDGDPTRHQWAGHEAIIRALIGREIPEAERAAVASALLLTDIRPMCQAEETERWVRAVAAGDDCDASFNPDDSRARFRDGYAAWCPDCFGKLWRLAEKPLRLPFLPSRDVDPQSLVKAEAKGGA